MPHRTALLWALAAGTLLAGCAESTTQTLPPAVPPVELPAPGPLTAYLQQVDARSVARITEDRTRACVADAGFLYWPDDPHNEISQDTLPFARAWGYGGLSLSVPTAAEQNAAYAETLSPQDHERYAAVLDGCATAPVLEPAQYVEEPAQDWASDPQFAGLHADYEQWIVAAVDDPRVHAADAAWSACMSEAGHDVASPDEAEQQASAATRGGNVLFTDDPEVQEAEIALAVADLTCRDSTGYTESTRAAWHTLQQEFVDAHRDQLEALVATHGL
ncbi:hypothetical protein [Cellulomonas terrae]|uniref:Glycoside-hydrolase family GH114 TIM-barrel domain-containing protein n=1 Tax=Cellulomonas terrae TaxID=311234 RepID=A0A511JL96_9CELL|nr:hypothetical protein [Cellulomonas terrae]GEL98780.1 hypothetical protein CTE05_23270 [Cellulomonas terrae]